MKTITLTKEQATLACRALQEWKGALSTSDVGWEDVDELIAYLMPITDIEELS